MINILQITQDTHLGQKDVGVGPAAGGRDDVAAYLSLHCMWPCTTVQDQVWADWEHHPYFTLTGIDFPFLVFFKAFFVVVF